MAVVARAVDSGSGINVLVDPGATGDMQVAKLAYGASTNETLIGADANGLDVDVTRVNGVALPADTTNGLLVNPGPQTFRIEVNSAGLTTASTSYTAGDQEGTEMTFASAARVSGQGGIIQSAVLLDKSKILSATPAEMDLLFFSSSVTGASDNSPFDDSDTDMGEYIGRVKWYATDWLATASNATNERHNLGIAYNCDATSLFGIFVGRTNHTFYTAATDLRVALTVLRD